MLDCCSDMFMRASESTRLMLSEISGWWSSRLSRFLYLLMHRMMASMMTMVPATRRPANSAPSFPRSMSTASGVGVGGGTSGFSRQCVRRLSGRPDSDVLTAQLAPYVQFNA